MRAASARLGLAFAILGFAPTHASAEEAASVLGAGTAQCGQWSSYRSQNQDVLVDVVVSWTLGYVSGVASRSGSRDVRHVEADATSVQAWLDTDCLSQPSKTIAEAAEGFVADLSRRSAAEKRRHVEPAKPKSAPRP
ncbi:MAG: hypothetical protein ABI369_04155 [Acetobacteraceae bacterium]